MRWVEGFTRPAFWSGLAVGGGLALAALELPYVNWQPVVPPLEVHPLVFRHDAKGDGRFGAPRSGQRRHRGVDLAAALDSPVRAIRSGLVLQVGLHRGLGRFVEVEHAQRLRSLYAHLNKVTVEPGDRVRQGQTIGLVGKTGNARHPWIASHLHLEVSRDGEIVDPQTLGFIVQEPGSPPESAMAAAMAEATDARGGE